jgi:hypothetical protein
MHGRRELASYAPGADADGAGEGASGVDESVEGLGSRDKEQNLQKQNARLAVEVRALKAQVAALGLGASSAFSFDMHASSSSCDMHASSSYDMYASSSSYTRCFLCWGSGGPGG